MGILFFGKSKSSSGGGVSTFATLTDVTAGTPVDGDVYVYDSATSKFVPISTRGIIPSAPPVNQAGNTRETGPLNEYFTGVQFTSTRQFLERIWLYKGDVLHSAHVACYSTAGTLTKQWMAVFERTAGAPTATTATYTCRATSADLTNTALGLYKTYPFGVDYTVPATGWYFLSYAFTGSPMPNMACRTSTSPTTPTLTNESANHFLDTASPAVLPTVGSTITANPSTITGVWVGLSAV